MASTATKVRLVRCPKCWKVLLESGENPVYQCGGCGATLKAKNRKVQESISSEDDKTSTHKSEHDSEEKEMASSNVKAMKSHKDDGSVPSEDHKSSVYSLVHDSAKKELASLKGKEIMSSIEEKSECSSITTEVASSGDQTCREEGELLGEAGEKRKADRNNERSSSPQDPSPERQVVSGSSSTSPSERLSDASDSLPIHTSLANEQLEFSQNPSPRKQVVLGSSSTAASERSSDSSDSSPINTPIANEQLEISQNPSPRKYSPIHTPIANEQLEISQNPSPRKQVVLGSSSSAASEKSFDSSDSLPIHTPIANEQQEISQKPSPRKQVVLGSSSSAASERSSDSSDSSQIHTPIANEQLEISQNPSPRKYSPIHTPRANEQLEISQNPSPRKQVVLGSSSSAASDRSSDSSDSSPIHTPIANDQLEISQKPSPRKQAVLGSSSSAASERSSDSSDSSPIHTPIANEQLKISQNPSPRKQVVSGGSSTAASERLSDASYSSPTHKPIANEQLEISQKPSLGKQVFSGSSSTSSERLSNASNSHIHMSLADGQLELSQEPSPERQVTSERLSDARSSLRMDTPLSNKKMEISQNPSRERQVVSQRSSTSASERLSAGSNASHIHISLPDEQLQVSQNIVQHTSDDIKPSNTVETTERTDDSLISKEDMFQNKLSDTLQDTSKSQLPNSRSYHNYDGSVSSDGWDDQVSDDHLPKRSFFDPELAAAFVSSKEKHIRGDLTATDGIINRAEVQHEERKLPSLSLNKKKGPVAMESVKYNQDELLQPTRYEPQAQEQVGSTYSEGFYSVKSWLGMETEEVVSNEPCSSAGSENGGPLSYRHGDYLPSSSLHPPNNLELVERNQLELLRKVDELREQLNRSYAYNGKMNGRHPTRGTPQEKQSLYYDHKPRGRDMLQQYDVNYSRGSREVYRLRSSSSQQSSYPQTPFSGKATTYRHHAGCSCAHGYQDDWQSLRKLPPSNLCYNGPCMTYAGHSYIPYSSGSSSPQHHSQYRYPTGRRGTQAESPDQISVPREMENLHYPERRRSIKRHCLPVAGASPFIICSGCSSLLQLPAEFLISTKRRHRLQCSACSKVLVFALHQRSHLVPYSSNAAVAQLNGADAIGTSSGMRNFATATNPNGYPHGHHVSYSEDGELSICKSASTADGTPASSTRAISPVKNKSVRTHSSSNSSKPTEERRKTSIFQQSGNKQKSPVKASNYENPRPHWAIRDKSPSETERRSPALGSPLHRLMGYSSARDIIDASSDSEFWN